MNLDVNECMALINQAIADHPDDFSFLPQTGVDFQTERIRLQEDLTSNLVGIRMDKDEILAEGVLGDGTSSVHQYHTLCVSFSYLVPLLTRLFYNFTGMIFYPFPWCTNANKYYHCETDDITFDCGVGGLLNYTECCDLIKADPRVKRTDIKGDNIGCYPDYPVGSISNPRVEDRVFLKLDENNIVVHPPKIE